MLANYNESIEKMTTSNQFMRFILVGGFAAAVNVGARLIFNYFTSYEVAIVLAFPLAVTVAFSLNRLYVFDLKQSHAARQYVRFAIVNVIALVQVWIVSVALARWLFPVAGFTWHSETVAHSLGVMSPVGTSYVAHKYYTFSK